MSSIMTLPSRFVPSTYARIYPGFITKQHIGIEVNKNWVYVLFVTSFPTITIPGFNVTILA